MFTDIVNLLIFITKLSTGSCRITVFKVGSSKIALGAHSVRQTISCVDRRKNNQLVFCINHCLANSVRLGSGIAVHVRRKTILITIPSICSFGKIKKYGTVVCTSGRGGVNVNKGNVVSNHDVTIQTDIRRRLRGKRVRKGMSSCTPTLVYVRNYRSIGVRRIALRSTTGMTRVCGSYRGIAISGIIIGTNTSSQGTVSVSNYSKIGVASYCFGVTKGPLRDTKASHGLVFAGYVAPSNGTISDSRWRKKRGCTRRVFCRARYFVSDQLYHQ